MIANIIFWTFAVIGALVTASVTTSLFLVMMISAPEWGGMLRDWWDNNR